MAGTPEGGPRARPDSVRAGRLHTLETLDNDLGDADVLRAALHHAAGELGGLCETVTTALLPPGHRAADDAALLVARTHRLAPESIATWPLPEDPIAARQAREHVRRRLAAWDLGELGMTTELIVSELIGNVVRHAKGPIHLRLLRSRTLTCEVSDASLTTPHIRHTSATDEGGRGLQLVATMAQRWGTRHTADGKVIWTEQPIPADTGGDEG
ncbi:ATP-binding protein [Streptomyces sp. URMC 129]|uniref:ATP-binding protein n=1 Tax=Streptomyces sp. URMC 129 TaxID=3423407 RepID=UPI003F1A2552